MNVAEALEIENSINTLFFASSLASYFVCSGSFGYLDMLLSVHRYVHICSRAYVHTTHVS